MQIDLFLLYNGVKCHFTVRAQSGVLMVSTKGVADNDDSEACDIIFQTGHLMSRNLVK